MEMFVSSSPHVRAGSTTQRIMLDVVIALLPACVVGIVMFGLNALVLLCLSVMAAVVTEYLLGRLLKRPVTVGDLSAVVTGLLLGMNLPPTAPWWVAVIGSVFAIGIVKVCFGGIGCNFVNPALAGRALLMACWPAIMTTWSGALGASHFGVDGVAGATAVDALASATPLAAMKMGYVAPLADLFIGRIGGCIGEVSAAALLLGAIYLFARRVITPRIPLSYICTVFLITLCISGFDFTYSLAQILAGGLFLGAFFMANDYTTSPITPSGQILMGIGCGVLTVIIRQIGGYPEGVSYSILLMNLAVPLIERGSRPLVLGERHKNPFAKAKKGGGGDA